MEKIGGISMGSKKLQLTLSLSLVLQREKASEEKRKRKNGQLQGKQEATTHAELILTLQPQNEVSERRTTAKKIGVSFPPQTKKKRCVARCLLAIATVERMTQSENMGTMGDSVSV